MTHLFHPAALDEHIKAAEYYFARQPGLEFRYLDAVQKAIEGVSATPERFRYFDGEIRRCLVRVFPYAVLYSVERDFVYIIAIMHCHREPGYRRDRLKG